MPTPKLYEALRATERVAGEESQSAITLRTELQRRLNAGLTDSWDDHMIDLLLRVEPMDVSEVVAHVIIPWFERMLSVWEPLGYHDQLLLACLRCYVNCCGLFAYQELDNGEVEVTERTKQLIRDCNQALEAYGNDR